MRGRTRLYVNIFLNIGVAKPDKGTNKTVRRFAELLNKYGLKGDFYMRGDSAQSIAESAPEAIELLKTSGMSIAYHSEARPPYPILGDRIKDMSWDDAVDYVRRYESEKLDPDTGKLDPDPNKMGGLKAMQKIFGASPNIAGRFFGPEIPYVYKEMGVRMATFLSLPGHFSFWYMGLLCRPGNVSLGTPSIFKFLDSADNAFNLSSPLEQLKVLIEILPETRINTFIYGGHVADFGKERTWEIFTDGLAFIAEHPKIKVVTALDFWDMVVPLESECLLSLEQVHQLSDAVAWKNLPDYISLDNEYFSLADTFQALASSLSFFHEHGTLPKSVKIREILGPIDDLKLKGSVPNFARVKVKGKEILKTAFTVHHQIKDCIPSSISLSAAGREVNPAELLQVMAKELQIIKAKGAVGPVVLEPKSVITSLASKMRGRFETTRSGQRLRLQFWTIKPAKTK